MRRLIVMVLSAVAASAFVVYAARPVTAGRQIPLPTHSLPDQQRAHPEGVPIWSATTPDHEAHNPDGTLKLYRLEPPPPHRP